MEDKFVVIVTIPSGMKIVYGTFKSEVKAHEFAVTKAKRFSVIGVSYQVSVILDAHKE
jgi:hypothetical protein